MSANQVPEWWLTKRGERNGEPYGNVPVQADGEVDGLPWYFRARYNHWEFAVSKNPRYDPAAVGLRNGPEGWFISRPWMAGYDTQARLWPHYASWMPTRYAKKIIAICLAMWRNGQLEAT